MAHRLARRQACALRQGAISIHQKQHTPPKRLSPCEERQVGRRADMREARGSGKWRDGERGRGSEREREEDKGTEVI